jgi:RNA polymerase sigma-70 factor (ECF subfamily)
MRDPTERPLLLALRRGDAAAFDAVYARHRARVYAFLRRLSRRGDIAEDLFQETWLRLAQNARRLHEDTDLRAWLFTVARNAWVSHGRRAPPRGVEPLSAANAADLAVHAGDPDDRVEAATKLERLERALASLPDGAREVLLLVGVEGFEQEEAAAMLGISYDALRQRLGRARAQLALALERPAPTEANP